MESSPFFISFHLFSYLPLCVQPGSLPQNLTSKSPANKWFLIQPELKIMVYVTALLQKFSDNQVCIVICTGHAIHMYSISQQSCGSMVFSQPTSAVWHTIQAPAKIHSKPSIHTIHCVPKKRPPFYFSNNSVKN